MVLEIVVIEGIPRLLEVTAVASTAGLSWSLALGVGLGLTGIALLTIGLILLYYF